MTTFLQLLADDLIRRHRNDMDRLTVLFPNKRAGLFLAEALSQRIQHPLWMPDILTLPEFIERHTGLRRMDELPLIIKLYKAYTEVSGIAEKFEDFYFWGRMILGDFDDIDKYLADPKNLFANVVSLKEVEANFPYLTPEQIAAIKQFWSSFNADHYSDEQQKFLRVWRNLYPTYRLFHDRLLGDGLCYEGMGQRLFLERIGDYADGRPLIFAGFNALTACEKQIFSFFRTNGQAAFYWDYDIYYTSNPMHEAGKFIRENLKLFPNELGPEHFNNFAHTDKQIEYISVPSNIGQAKLIPTLLEKKSYDNPRSTALVLCDERLLIPVMHSIPESIGKINITMGYPAQNTSVAALLSLLGDLTRYRKIQDGRFHYYFKPVLSMLNHKMVRDFCPDAADAAATVIRQKNSVYVDAHELQFSNLTRAIFPEGEQPVPDYLLRVLRQLSDTDAENAEAGGPQLQPMEKEFVFTFYTRIQSMKNGFEEEGITPDDRLYWQIIRRAVASTTIPFTGEPLEGLQVMGLQETRMLDFEELILFSANEGILPHTGRISSFIPYNLRVGFRLPTPDHQDALFAYYFYRVLQRARRVKILYNSATEALTSGEKSRFMTQLKYESGLPITEHNFQNRIETTERGLIEIPYNPEILQKLREYTVAPEKAISPSALNKYLQCPLQFYFSHIAGIKEKEDVTEELDSRLFGSLFHQSAQALYASFGGRMITTQGIDNLIQNKGLVASVVNKEYAKFYHANSSALVNCGTNDLVLPILQKQLQRMLQIDRELCPFRIIDLESRYVMPIPVTTQDGSFSVYVGGIIDRIDHTPDAVRIIDYKTGSDEMDFGGLDSLFNPEDKSRNKAAFQTMLYCLVFCNAHPECSILVPGLYKIREFFNPHFSSQFIFKEGQEKDPVTNFALFRDKFQKLLTTLLEALYAPNGCFRATADTDNCLKCPYSAICNRTGNA